MSAPRSWRHFGLLSKLLVSSVRYKVRNSAYCLLLRQLHSKELKKFYKYASVTESDGWFEVNLDKRKLKTPNGKIFQVPSEPLALAVAHEWNMQENVIKRYAMHLTSICNTAIDNPSHKTKAEMIQSILYYIETDTINYRMPEPKELLIFQQQHWDPLVHWLKGRYGITVVPTTGIESPDIPQETVDILTRHLLSFSDWALFGFQYASECIKSLIITLALVDRFITVERAVYLSRLEQEFQIHHWGSVEWSHEIDVFSLQSRLSAATLFIHWCSENSKVMQKARIQEVT